MKCRIYYLTKKQLIRELTDRGLDSSGTIDNLRRRLNQDIIEKAKMAPLGKIGFFANLEQGSSASSRDPTLPADNLLHHAKVMNQIRK